MTYEDLRRIWQEEDKREILILQKDIAYFKERYERRCFESGHGIAEIIQVLSTAKKKLIKEYRKKYENNLSV